MLQEAVGNFLGRGKGPTAVRDHGFICDGYSPAVLGKISPQTKKLERQSVGSIQKWIIGMIKEMKLRILVSIRSSGS